MSLKEKGSNDVYDVLGMSEAFRRDLIDNCFDKIDGVEHEDNSDVIKWETLNYVDKYKKNRAITAFKSVAAILVIGVVAFMMSIGINHLSKETDEDYRSVPLKNGKTTEETKKIVDSEVIIDNLGLFESTDNKAYSLDLSLYYKDGKLIDDYEKRTYEYKNEDGTTDEIQVVGKNFITISSEEAKTNIDRRTDKFDVYLSDGVEIKNNSKILENIKKDFYSKEYVYFILDDNLCRLSISDDGFIIWINNCAKYERLVKKGSMVYAIGTEKTETIVSPKCFYDINLKCPQCTEIGEGNKIVTFTSIITLDESIGDDYCYRMYYIDEDFTLWKVKNIYGYDENGNKINDISESENENGSKITWEFKDGSLSDNRVKIAENVYGLASAGVKDLDVSVYKMKNFKEVTKDKKVVYFGEKVK